MDAGSVDNFISEQENKATSQKNRTRRKTITVLHLFLETKNEERKMEDILTAELNEYVSEFINSVRTKDGKEYEPSSLRNLLAISERHLNKNYPASIINDLAFKKTLKTLKTLNT
ncbi:Hypothetical predicted protein [Paramuricea clavata]|uniref:Uncharacterized protein n=1 Tax=Paramuricea clavata TaxID=317549 RepID=A0A6S7K739_PARCT|nr:Hypothetical predicted protein [Paramuricea clavata]